MRDKREIEGKWWINGKGQPPHYGTLRYDPETELTLVVKGPVDCSAPLIVSQASSSLDVIHGLDHQDRPVTLFGGAFQRASRSGKQASFDIDLFRALLGGDFPSWKETRFARAQVRFNIRIAFTQTMERDLEIPLDSQTQIIMKPEVGTSPATEGRLVEFRFVESLSAGRIYSDFIHPFLWLLTLLVGSPVYINSLHFGVDQADIELLMTNRGVTNANRYRGLEVQHSFVGIVQRWFQDHPSLASARQCYFATIFNRGLYMNHQFLLMAQALEVYHNSRHSISSVQPKDVFKSRLEAILQCVPVNERPWWKEKLHYANQRTLAERLEDILGSHPTEVAKIIPDKAWFAAKVRHTRNYYTHFDEELKRKGKIASDAELLPLITQMRALLEICFLKDLGIAGEPLNRVVQRCASTEHYTFE